MQPTTDFQNHSTRTFQKKLQPIDEEKTERTVVPKPTKIDDRRDVQVLTLNDDGINNQQPKYEAQDQVPF